MSFTIFAASTTEVISTALTQSWYAITNILITYWPIWVGMSALSIGVAIVAKLINPKI